MREKKQSKGDREKKQEFSNGKQETINEKNDFINQVKKETAKNAAGTGANEFLKQNLILQLKLKLQQIQAIIQNLSTLSFSSIITACLVSIIAIVGGIFGGVINGQKDDVFVDCTVYIDKGMIGNSNNFIDANKIKRQTAKRIYSVLHYYGLRPEQCFAVLGNWELESNLDPTAVESIFDENYKIGRKKEHASRNDFVLKKWNPSYAELYPAITRNGIGLGQWTNERNQELLEYAKLYGMDYFTSTLKGNKDIESLWYELDIQLAYALDTASVGDSGASWFSSWKNLGKDEWDGDKKVNIPFHNIKNWSSQTEKNGVYPEEDIACHPVGEDNLENTIGSDSEDTYYKQEDRDQAIVQATNQLQTEWDSILDAHKPENYAWTEEGHFEDHGYWSLSGWVSNEVWIEPVYHNGVDEANAAAKEAYKKRWKYFYRYYLYENTVKTYTKQFMQEWEGINNDTVDTRIQYALDYFNEWWNEAQKNADEGDPNYYVGADDATDNGDYFFHVEEGYASGIMDVMNKTINDNWSINKIYRYDQDIKECNRVTMASRKNIAECAAMIAWPNKDASQGNDGTDMYKWIHDRVIEGDTVYASCDRTVCTAIRWSGYDDNYPAGATLNQIQYLVTSPRWVELDWGGDKKQLQPGDVLIRKDSVEASSETEDANDTHHTVIYIGEYVASAYADSSLGAIDSGACIVHGSYGERSPAIDVWNDSLNTYHAFRCIYPMGAGESKYAAVGYP